MARERGFPGKSLLKGALTSVTGVVSGEQGAADLKKRFKEFRGESRAGQTLAGLPGPWRVFRQVDLGGENADYVAVGPRGVSCIEVKSCDAPVAAGSRGLFIGGMRNNGPVERAVRRSGLLEEVLGVEVQAVLAVACPDLTGDTVDGLPVLLLSELPDFLLGDARPRMSWDAAARIFSALERVTR